MFKFKSFSGTPGNIDKEINDFLANNPSIIPSNMQMCNNGVRLYVSILFSDMPALPKFDYETLPIGITRPDAPPREVTCDDPWKGEYIPIGDPPSQRPKVLAMKPTPKPVVNAMEQFGAFTS